MENSKLPAFPMDFAHDGHSMQTGLTKREYYAGLAMQGLIVDVSPGKQDFETIAKWSVEAADQLLKALEKK